MTSVTISKSDLLATIAQYRTTVEGQQGAATPYPADREDELERIDAFTKSVQDSKCATAKEMLDIARANAASSLKTFNKFNYPSFFGGMGIIAVGLLPAVRAVAGPIPMMVGFLAMCIGGRIASGSSAAYRENNNFANELDGYRAYAEAQAAKNPPGVGPITQPAICPMPATSASTSQTA